MVGKMIRIEDKGFTLNTEKGEFFGLQRCLTPAEVNYEQKLRQMNLPYQFKHQFYEMVTSIDSLDGLKGLRSPQIFRRETEKIKQKANPHSHRLCSHLYEIARGIETIPQDIADLYIKLQLESNCFDLITMLDRDKSSDETILEADIARYIEPIRKLNKTPRVLIDAALPNEIFERKCQKAIDLDIKMIAVKHASFFDNSENFYFLKQLADEGVFTQITGIERRLRKRHFNGKELAPLSYPSFMAYFGFKSNAVRAYPWFPAMGQNMVPDDLRLFQETDHGLYKLKDSIEKFGEEFETGTDFTPFQDLNKQGIFSLAEVTEQHHPVYAFESAASRNELQSMTKYVKKGQFFECASEKACLNTVVQALGLE